MGKYLELLPNATSSSEHLSPYGTESYFILGAESESSSAAEHPRVLSILAIILERVVARNNSIALSLYGSCYGGSKPTVFHGLRPPNIGINEYLERISKYANCSPACFVVAYIYVDRIINGHSDLHITSLNVHRLLITSVMLAAKFLDDAYFNNAYYAKVGGVSTEEMNKLELEFLFRLDFRLFVSPTEFGNYAIHLEQEHVGLEVQYGVQTPPRDEIYGRPSFHSPSY